MPSLVEALIENGSCVVSSCFSFVYKLNLHFDVVHLQWPEAAFWGGEKISIQGCARLINALKSRKMRGEKILLTMHNEYPHSDGKLGIELYQQVMSLVDGVIHLAEASIGIAQGRYQKQLSDHVVHKVIPHILYSNYTNNISHAQARKLIAADPSRRHVLVFGAIRSADERDLILGLTKNFRERGGCLHLVGQPPFGRRELSYYKYFIPLWRAKGVFLRSGFLPDEEVQSYFKGCDALLIPRIDTLNSGNVYLGLTFEIPVIGPDCGNISAVLKDAGQSLFYPSQLDKSGDLIDNVIDDKINRLKLIKDYVRNYPTLDEIANLHLNFYTEISYK